MKQNQYLNRLIPGAKSQVKKHDFLNLKACCSCSQCINISHSINPQILLDQELIELKKCSKINQQKCDFVFFLNTLQAKAKHLPKFKFLDTVVLQDGVPSYALHFEGGKLKISYQVNTKNWIISRKQSLDLQYQIQKHERQNNFQFTAFEHACEKKIKQFENNIKYKVPGVLNKTAIIKLKNKNHLEVLSRNQYLNMFDITKARIYNMKEIQYIQVFPVMTGEEQSSYIKTIKYFRNKQCIKKSFKLAQLYVSCWKQKNDTIERLEDDVYEDIRKAEGLESITQEHKLFYQTYKLFIYFEQISNIRIQQAVLQYITNDKGKSFFFKSLECLQTQKRISVADIGIQLPSKKDIATHDHIHLPTAMQGLFQGFQNQFQRLDKERQEMELKLKKDKQYSNFVYKTILEGKRDNFHDVLSSKNMKYKKKQLNL